MTKKYRIQFVQQKPSLKAEKSHFDFQSRVMSSEMAMIDFIQKSLASFYLKQGADPRSNIYSEYDLLSPEKIAIRFADFFHVIEMEVIDHQTGETASFSELLDNLGLPQHPVQEAEVA